jgi:hypothetical protein
VVLVVFIVNSDIFAVIAMMFEVSLALSADDNAFL